MIRPDRMPMTPLHCRFIDDMRLRNLSPRTIETYVTAVVRVATSSVWPINSAPPMFAASSCTCSNAACPAAPTEP